MSSSPHTIKWGILATGSIADLFAKDLLMDPSTRDVHDVAHEVVAAASSTSADRAKDFLKQVGAPSAAKAYGSYKELVADPNVEIIYVATPHSHHFQNTMLCLEAGKHVLCEKAFTTNAAQAKILCETAQKKKLFLMEAVWTRFFPLSIELRNFVKEGKLGPIQRILADLSRGHDVDKEFGTTSRMTNLDLAGGALLDLGLYPTTWCFQFGYHIAAHPTKPKVAASMKFYDKTGADENTTLLLTFPDSGIHAISTSSFRFDFDPDEKGTAGAPIRIQGLHGEIQVFGTPFRPTHYRLIPSSRKGANATFKYEEVHKKIPGQGMHWEADECARCLRDGKLESTGMPHSESIVIMEVFDEARKQAGLKYPEKIESTEYPLEGF